MARRALRAPREPALSPLLLLLLMLAAAPPSSLAQVVRTAGVIEVSPSSHGASKDFLVTVIGPTGLSFHSNTAGLNMTFMGEPCVLPPISGGAGRLPLGFSSGDDEIGDTGTFFAAQILCLVTVPEAKWGTEGSFTYVHEWTDEEGVEHLDEYVSEPDTNRLSVTEVPRNELFFQRGSGSPTEPAEWFANSFAGTALDAADSLNLDLFDGPLEGSTVVYLDSGEDAARNVTVENSFGVFVRRNVEFASFSWEQVYAPLETDLVDKELQRVELGNPERPHLYVSARVLSHPEDPNMPQLCLDIKETEQIRCASSIPVVDAEGWRLIEFSITPDLGSEPRAELYLQRMKPFEIGQNFDEINAAVSIDLVPPERNADGTLADVTAFSEYLLGNGTVANPGLQRPLLWADVLVTTDRPLEVRSAKVIQSDSDEFFTTEPPYECSAPGEERLTLQFVSSRAEGFPSGELDVETITVNGVPCEPLGGGALISGDRSTITCEVPKVNEQQASDVVMTTVLGVPRTVTEFVFHTDEEWTVPQTPDPGLGVATTLGWTGVSTTEQTDDTGAYLFNEPADENQIEWLTDLDGTSYLFLSPQAISTRYDISRDAGPYVPTRLQASGFVLLAPDDDAGVRMCVSVSSTELDEPSLTCADKVALEPGADISLSTKYSFDIDVNFTEIGVTPDDYTGMAVVLVRNGTEPGAGDYSGIKPVAFYGISLAANCAVLPSTAAVEAAGLQAHPLVVPPQSTLFADWGCKPDALARAGDFGTYTVALVPTNLDSNERFDLSGVAQIVTITVVGQLCEPVAESSTEITCEFVPDADFPASPFEGVATLTSLFGESINTTLLQYSDPDNIGDQLLAAHLAAVGDGGDPATSPWSVTLINGSPADQSLLTVYNGTLPSGDDFAGPVPYYYWLKDAAGEMSALLGGVGTSAGFLQRVGRFRGMRVEVDVMVAARALRGARLCVDLILANGTEVIMDDADCDSSLVTVSQQVEPPVIDTLTLDIGGGPEVDLVLLGDGGVRVRLGRGPPSQVITTEEFFPMLFSNLKVYENCLTDLDPALAFDTSNAQLVEVSSARPRDYCSSQQFNARFLSAPGGGAISTFVSEGARSVREVSFSITIISGTGSTVDVIPCENITVVDGLAEGDNPEMRCTVALPEDGGVAGVHPTGQVESLEVSSAFGEVTRRTDLGLSFRPGGVNLLASVVSKADRWTGATALGAGTGGAAADSELPFHVLLDPGVDEAGASMINSSALGVSEVLHEFSNYYVTVRLARPRGDPDSVRIRFSGSRAADTGAVLSDAAFQASAGGDLGDGRVAAVFECEGLECSFSAVLPPASATEPVRYDDFTVVLAAEDVPVDVTFTGLVVSRAPPGGAAASDTALVVAGLNMAHACVEEADPDLVLGANVLLPVVTAVSNRAACPDGDTRLTLTGSSGWGLSTINSVVEVRVGDRPCTDLSSSGDALSCTVVGPGADTTAAPVTVRSLLDSSEGHDASGRVYVGFVDGVENLALDAARATGWTQWSGADLADGAAEGAPLDGLPGAELPTAEYWMRGNVSAASVEMRFDDHPTVVFVTAHAEQGAEDSAELRVCLDILEDSVADLAAGSEYPRACQTLASQLQAVGTESAAAARPIFDMRFEVPAVLPTASWRARLSLERAAGFGAADDADTRSVRWSGVRVAYRGTCAESAVEVGAARVTPEYEVRLSGVQPERVQCLPFNTTTRVLKLATPFVGEAGSLFTAVPDVDWAVIAALANGSLAYADAPVEYSQEGVPYPWVPRIEVGPVAGNRRACVITNLYLTADDLPVNSTDRASNIFCTLTVPDDDLSGFVGVQVLGQFVVDTNARFAYKRCIVDESVFAVAARDAALYTTGFSLFVALVVGAFTLINAAASTNSASASSSQAVSGRGDLFRMIFFLQYVAALQFTSGDWPKTNLEFGDSWAWSNGMILPPWDECVDPNEGKGEFDQQVPDNLPCKVPEGQLFLATLYWQALLALVILASIQVFIVILRHLWHRVRSVRTRLDVDTVNNFHLVPIMVSVRLATLAVYGISLTSTFEIVNMAGTAAATAVAFAVFFVFVLGFPLLNYVVASRMRPGSSQLADSTRTKAVFAFGSLFSEYQPGWLLASVLYLCKRMAVGVAVGALDASAEGQLGLVLAAGVAYATFLAVYRPFQLPGENQLSLMLELAEVSQSFLMLMFVLTGAWQLLTVAFVVIALVGLLFIWLTVRNLKAARRAWDRLRKRMKPVPKVTAAEEFELDDRATSKAIRGAASSTFGSLSTLQLKEKAVEDRANDDERERKRRDKKKSKKKRKKHRKKSKRRSSSRHDLDEGFDDDAATGDESPRKRDSSRRRGSDAELAALEEGAPAGSADGSGGSSGGANTTSGSSPDGDDI